MNPWIKRIGILVVVIYAAGVVIAWRRLKMADIVNAASLAFRWPFVSTNPDRYQASAE